MRNIEKVELKREIIDLAKSGHTLKQALRILKGEYSEASIRNYWKVFGVREEKKNG